MKLPCLAAAAAALMLIGCGAPLPGYYDTLDYRTAAGIATTQGAGTMVAFYATNRQPAGGSVEVYGAARGDGLRYGSCDVRIPRIHHIGSDVITEQLSRAAGRPAPEPLVVTATRESTDSAAFFAELNAAVRQTPRGDVLVLVHGYNNSFSGPVARAAGLACDLGYPMVPVAYCWTSQATYQDYLTDENDVDLAARQLAVFLGQLIDAVPADARLHLVAHSMGSRVATSALAHLQAARRFGAGAKPFRNLVFAAADIDAAEFRARMSDDGLSDMAVRTTLYASSNDRALDLSTRLHGRRYPRAGQAGQGIVITRGVETIDVSLNDASFVGHGYYGDNRAVIQDLFLLLVHDAPPDQRNLYYADSGGSRYWLIRP